MCYRLVIFWHCFLSIGLSGCKKAPTWERVDPTFGWVAVSDGSRNEGVFLPGVCFMHILIMSPGQMVSKIRYGVEETQIEVTGGGRHSIKPQKNRVIVDFPEKRVSGELSDSDFNVIISEVKRVASGPGNALSYREILEKMIFPKVKNLQETVPSASSKQIPVICLSLRED